MTIDNKSSLILAEEAIFNRANESARQLTDSKARLRASNIVLGAIPEILELVGIHPNGDEIWKKLSNISNEILRGGPLSDEK